MQRHKSFHPIYTSVSSSLVVSTTTVSQNAFCHVMERVLLLVFYSSREERSWRTEMDRVAYKK